MKFDQNVVTIKLPIITYNVFTIFIQFVKLIKLLAKNYN